MARLIILASLCDLSTAHPALRAGASWPVVTLSGRNQEDFEYFAQLTVAMTDAAEKAPPFADAKIQVNGDYVTVGAQ